MAKAVKKKISKTKKNLKPEKKASLRLSGFLKEPFVWIFISFQAVVIFSQLLLILNNIQKAPSLLPLVGYYDSLAHALLPKYSILAIPVLSFLIFAFGLNISRKNYETNKWLTIYICILISIVVASLLFHVIKIIVPFNG